jgi:hypothetical protein
MHTAEPLVPESRCLEIEISIENVRRYKSLGIDQIPAELPQAGGNTLRSEIHIFFNSIWNKEELLQKWKDSIIILIYEEGDEIVCSNYTRIMLLPITYKILSSSLISRITPRGRNHCGSTAFIST